jgi:hypothetical protein
VLHESWIVRRDGDDDRAGVMISEVAVPLARQSDLRPSLPSGRGGELSEERSWTKRDGEPSVMRCGAQRPDVNVELVSQNSKRLFEAKAAGRDRCIHVDLATQTKSIINVVAHHA